uniref:Uncharacterized protein n=1 Tax=Alexandrium monilatum TaxID=311494 RepID=A0A7S4RFJ0_9DINO|mmetsp:Transcript_95110/g.293244  ORF Transcript_95110/g.293244 Transcript_95110/m.293244 type:complete len:178 (+) Transcript_95110:36-569(+)
MLYSRQPPYVRTAAAPPPADARPSRGAGWQGGARASLRGSGSPPAESVPRANSMAVPKAAFLGSAEPSLAKTMASRGERFKVRVKFKLMAAHVTQGRVQEAAREAFREAMTLPGSGIYVTAEPGQGLHRSSGWTVTASLWPRRDHVAEVGSKTEAYTAQPAIFAATLAERSSARSSR